MMTKNIYGIDITKKVTPLMVRGAIIKCFTVAHAEILERMKDYMDLSSKKEFEEMKKMRVVSVVEKAFTDADGDFKNPNKESLLGAVSNLAEYGKNFRDPIITSKHQGEIMQLIDKLE